mgnify:FL=1|jgi:hypothetical protein
MSNSHIPLEEMLEDLRVTNEEITQYIEENDVLSKDYDRNRVQIYMNEGRIGQRRKFAGQLEQIIKETYPEATIE